LTGDIWLTGIRPGELWRISANTNPPEAKQNLPPGVEASAGRGQAKTEPPAKASTPLLPGSEQRQPVTILQNQAGNRPDLIFNDILPVGPTQGKSTGDLAATHRGLFWRPEGQPDWQPVANAPDSPAYVLAQANDRFYAGFEGQGLWSAASLPGPWQRTTLTAASVIDLSVLEYRLPEHAEPIDRLYAATATEIFVNNGLDPGWHMLSLPALSNQEMEEAGESPGDKFKPRLFSSVDGKLLVRHQDRLWLQSQPESGGWVLFGPEALHGKLFSVLNCCAPGALAGSNDAGIWQLTAGGEWQRLDDGFFSTTDVTELLQVDETYYAAGDLGLFQSQDGRAWQKVAGLPGVISDLLVDPTKPARWLAGTPAGLYRSQDGGQSWESVSPPWTIWDLAIGPQDRFFVGRSNGLAWADDLSATPIRWQSGEGLERVYFLRVNPHPLEPQRVWAGTWGNNIAVSNDGGQKFEPLHHGLETLSGLDLIWHATPGQVTLATFEGLYRSDDGGQSWFRLPGPLSHQTIYTLLQTDDGAIWAGAADGLWLSRDYGANWEPVKGLSQMTVLRLGRLTLPPPPLPENPPFIPRPNDALVYAPRAWLWAGTEGSGVWLSQDGGATWHFAGLAKRTIYNLLFDPLQPRRLVAATDRGIMAVMISEEAILAMAR
jgi:photosystem II stability/assembly factor-like uncharacterized protein